MLFAGLLFILFIVELFYFKIAAFFNITDKPNGRSSHETITLRGGGIIFSISILLYYLVFGFVHYFFAAGLFALTAISFADDIKEQGRWLRAVVQFVSVLLLLFQAGFSSQPWFLWPAAVIVLMGLLNAFNFMDGINGITAGYSFTVIAALFVINRQLHAFDERLLLCLFAGNLVFSYFNFRKKARCFAGDAGSISMAYILLFLTTLCVIVTSNPIFLLFFTVYLVDVILTILHRLFKRENIFEPHRQHLFQYLANEQKLPHLLVSGIYMIIQALMNAGVLYVWDKAPLGQLSFTLVAVGLTSVAHLFIKSRILRKLYKQSFPA